MGVVLWHDAWTNRFHYSIQEGWSPVPARVLAWGFEEVGDAAGPLPVMEPQYWVELEHAEQSARPRRFRERLSKSAWVNTAKGRCKAVDLTEGDTVTAWFIKDASAPPTIAPTAGPTNTVRLLLSTGVGLFGLLMLAAGLAAL